MLISDTAHLTLFSLVLMRMSGFILLNPILGRRNIPMTVKAGLVLALALPVYSFSSAEVPQIDNAIVYCVLLLKEFAVGYVVGFVTQLFFMVITFAGFVMDFQMGLSMATVYDPQNNAQIPVTGGLLQAYFVLLFFAVDGHLALMKILLTSAEIVPYGGVLLTQNISMRVLEIFVQCIEMGVKFAMPILAAEFLVEMGVGILNKAVPQISIFVINIQLKIIVGLGLLVILFSPISDYVEKIMTTMMKTIEGILTFL